MNSAYFPQTIVELEEELKKHAEVGRGGVGDEIFRGLIAMDNLGAFTRHITHDQNLNPTARPHGSRQSEINDAGHCILQVMTYVISRGIPLEDAINAALIGLRQNDFQKKSAQNKDDDLIIGMTGCPGIVRGRAFLDPHMTRAPPVYAGKPTNIILVTNHPYSDARLKRFSGIITDNGGTMCHAAIIARENGIPCVVGTGDGTERIKNGDIIEINATVEQGQVKKI